MAGMLPGVELARRRRSTAGHHRHYHHHHQFNSSSQSRAESESSVYHHSAGTNNSTGMGEPALIARNRLEEKLRSFYTPSSRSNKQQFNKGEKSFDPLAYAKETRRKTGSEHGKQPLYLDRMNSQREVCSICLEDFQTTQQIMNLPCCHKYHSKCLVPWLTSHSHCPYCRTDVNSAMMRS